MALHETPPQSYRVLLAIWDHSVTWHPTQVNIPCPNLSQTDLYSIYLPQWDGRLSWLRWQVTSQDGLSAYRWSGIQVLTGQCTVGSWNSQPVDLTSDVLTTSKPNPDPPEDQSHQISTKSRLKRWRLRYKKKHKNNMSCDMDIHCKGRALHLHDKVYVS